MIADSKFQILKKDLLVHKLVKFAAEDLCVSEVIGYPYRTNKKVSASIKVSSITNETISGLHSYKTITLIKEFEDGSKLYKLANFTMRTYPPCIFYDGIFVIPKGSTYAINTDGEIVSDNIIYTGKFYKL